MREGRGGHDEQLRFRLAASADAQAVADLHAASWRRYYRGAYSDAFLDGDVLADRLSVWSDRLRQPDSRRLTLVAEHAGGLVGFANTVFEDDPTWGALLDNLHVADGHKRRGIGSRLMAVTARAVIERPRRTGLYLWVLEQNVHAQAFYQALRGSCVEPSCTAPRRGREPARRVAGSPGRRQGCDMPGQNRPGFSSSRESWHGR